MKTIGKESAYPEVHEEPQFNARTYGLTKREYFAAMAIQGVMANPHELPERNGPSAYKNIAVVAVNLADALIEALNEKT